MTGTKYHPPYVTTYRARPKVMPPTWRPAPIRWIDHLVPHTGDKIHVNQRSRWFNTCMDIYPGQCNFVQALDGVIDCVVIQLAAYINTHNYDWHVAGVHQHPAYRSAPQEIWYRRGYWFVGAWDPRALQGWGRGWVYDAVLNF